MDGCQPDRGAPGVAESLPQGLDLLTMQAMRRAILAARTAGRNETEAARDMAWALRPALPAALITDAVQHVLGRT